MEKSETTVRTRPQLNISLESEHLNPEEIKAHEADTLPMGNGPGDVAARGAVIPFFTGIRIGIIAMIKYPILESIPVPGINYSTAQK